MKKIYLTVALLLALVSSHLHSQNIIFDNGPFYNSPGTGAGGANESVLYTTTFGMSTIGFGNQQTAFNHCADDFTMPDCKFRIDSIVLYAYQTGSTTTSTITGVTFRIWDGVPDAPGSNIIYGDTTTNRLVRTAWSGAYRITETTVGNSTRPIMRNVCEVDSLVLDGGTYWIDWQTSGSLASGPWAPARTPLMTAITGNGRQRVGSIWNNAVDGGTGTPAQGFPFMVYGETFNVFAHSGFDSSACEQQNILLGGIPSGSGGMGSLTYAWTPATGLSNSAVANPILTITDTISYILTVTDSIGCMDTDTVTINAIPIPQSIITPSMANICSGDIATFSANTGVGYQYSWSNSDTAQTTSTSTGGNLILNITNAAGCTNSDTAFVIVNPMPDNTVNQSGTSLTSNANSGSYQWIDCDNSFSPISGATNQNYTATANGNYAVIVDLNGCVDTSACVTVFGLSINSLNPEMVTVFPNPATDIFFIKLAGSSADNYVVQITTALGQPVNTGFKNLTNGQLLEINAGGWATGLYIINGKNTVTGKEFKQRIIIE